MGKLDDWAAPDGNDLTTAELAQRLAVAIVRAWDSGSADDIAGRAWAIAVSVNQRIAENAKK